MLRNKIMYLLQLFFKRSQNCSHPMKKQEISMYLPAWFHKLVIQNLFGAAAGNWEDDSG